MSNVYEDLLIDIERFIMNIIGSITKDPKDSDFDYILERKNLFENPLTKDLVPTFIKTCRTPDSLWAYIKPKISTYAKRRAFVRSEFKEMVERIEQLQFNNVSVKLDSLLTIGNEFNYIQITWEKAKSKVEIDPEGAITNARTLLESCLKYVLDSLNVAYKDNGDLNVLYKSARKELNLSPDQHSEDNFVKVLSGCTSIVGGLAGIRNDYGDAHGKKIIHYKPAPRHARLVVNLAGAMSEFIIDTYLLKYAGKRDESNVTV